jgi:hypothetical protein
VESTTTAITLRRPPHGHDGTSVANTRRNSSAHRTRPAELEHQVGAAIAGRRVNGGAEGLGAYDPSSRREAAEGGGSDAGQGGSTHAKQRERITGRSKMRQENQRSLGVRMARAASRLRPRGADGRSQRMRAR